MNKVIARLTAPDPDFMPPVAIKKGEEVVTLHRAEGSEAAFAALSQIPSYTVPRPRKSSQVQRLMKLGRLLAYDGLEAQGPEQATATLLAVLREAYHQAKDTEPFKKIVQDKGKVEVRAVNWRFGVETDDEADIIQLDIAAENIDDLFDQAGKKLGEGLHKAWWKARVAEDSAVKITAKLELFALCLEPATLKKVEQTAQAAVQQWLNQHRLSINTLPEGRQQEYNEIRRSAADPEETRITYPTAIEGSKADSAWPKHLYRDSDNLFPAKFNTWETKVVETELARTNVIGWLRNPDRKEWSLCIPYRLGGETRSLYPDFLFIRSVAGQPVVDILDPHLLSLEDAPAKAAGLAEYAAKHGHQFGRIELIIIAEDELTKRLDLTDERIRDKVKAVTTNEHLRQLFDLV